MYIWASWIPARTPIKPYTARQTTVRELAISFLLLPTYLEYVQLKLKKKMQFFEKEVTKSFSISIYSVIVTGGSNECA